MTLDVVVARVAAALGRGHALFSPAPVDAAAGVSGSSATLTSVSNQIAASPQTLGASGQFANAYGDMAQQFSGRLSCTAALDAKLSAATNRLDSQPQGLPGLVRLFSMLRARPLARDISAWTAALTAMRSPAT